ncbi:MAG: eukaryotic-like serine/threonine-protein kinase [Blastococcus sp.]|jgi:serine/threonine protein kinase|nr:eukaryotic-like serine/threonine-protein kinase [Blastococcus sp.]
MGADTDRIGRVVGGRYELAGVLGRGGMGVVWLADDQLLDRQVALKEITFSLDLTDEERGILRERTMREARTAARLDHPCVTRVYDVVEEEDKPWLVMEHIPSRSLQEIVSTDGPLPPAAVARIGLDVLAALDAAHRAGIVHRDVKPANVLVGTDGHACLTDFGIATSTGDSSLTTQGAIIGSPSYMAPERANGEEPQPPVDLWSLGATLYTAAEGRLAFDRGEPMATLLAVVSEPPAPMTAAGPLEPVLLHLLAKDPASRADVAQARRGLEAVLGGRTPPAAPAPEPAPPPRPRAPIGGDDVQRLDSADLRALASASKALLGDVARGAARGARDLAGRELARRRGRPTARKGVPEARPRRWRFKRRWVLVPLLTTLAVIALGLVGLGLWLAHVFGQF